MIIINFLIHSIVFYDVQNPVERASRVMDRDHYNNDCNCVVSVMFQTCSFVPKCATKEGYKFSHDVERWVESYIRS